MYQVKYDMPEAQTDLELILEQVIYGAEVIIVRYGVEVARITALDGKGRGNAPATLQSQPC